MKIGAVEMVQEAMFLKFQRRGEVHLTNVASVKASLPPLQDSLRCNLAFERSYPVDGFVSAEA